MTRALGIAAALASSALIAAPALARSVGVEVAPGCAAPEGLSESLALELSATEWSLALPEGAADVRIALEACDESRWVARLADASGQPLRAPVDLEVGELPPRSRARVAALWLAEWLETLTPGPPSGDLDRPTRPARSDAREAPPVPELAAPSLRIRAMTLGAFRHYEDTPATLGGGDFVVQLARVGAPILAFELGLGVEGGVRWDAPLMTVSGSFAATVGHFVIASWLELTIGARFALRHLADYGFGQLGTVSVESPWHTALGGLARATLFVDRGLALVLEAELGGALSAATAQWSAGADLPPPEDVLFDGFFVAVRAGLALE